MLASTEQELTELHCALLRAQAMGFDKTAAAMQRVLEEMLKTREESSSAPLPKFVAGEVS